MVALMLTFSVNEPLLNVLVATYGTFTPEMKVHLLLLRLWKNMFNLDNITLHRSVYAFAQDLPLSQVHNEFA